MRYLIAILVISMASCINGIGQQPSEEAKKEAEFQEVIRKAKEQQIKNVEIMKAVDQKTQHVITKTTEQITTLKQEVQELKKDLNEANKKIKDVTNVNTGSKYDLRPIPGSKKDR